MIGGGRRVNTSTISHKQHGRYAGITNYSFFEYEDDIMYIPASKDLCIENVPMRLDPNCCRVPSRQELPVPEVTSEEEDMYDGFFDKEELLDAKIKALEKEAKEMEMLGYETVEYLKFKGNQAPIYKFKSGKEHLKHGVTQIDKIKRSGFNTLFYQEYLWSQSKHKVLPEGRRKKEPNAPFIVFVIIYQVQDKLFIKVVDKDEQGLNYNVFHTILFKKNVNPVKYLKTLLKTTPGFLKADNCEELHHIPSATISSNYKSVNANQDESPQLDIFSKFLPSYKQQPYELDIVDNEQLEEEILEEDLQNDEDEKKPKSKPK